MLQNWYKIESVLYEWILEAFSSILPTMFRPNRWLLWALPLHGLLATAQQGVSTLNVTHSLDVSNCQGIGVPMTISPKQGR